MNEYKNEPLTAVLPGVALQELWSIVGVAETALTAVSAMVVLTAILGMVTMILSTLNERRQEIAILRSIGAHTGTIFSLLMLEAVFLAAGGILLGTGLLYGLLFFITPWIEQSYGLFLAIDSAIPLRIETDGFDPGNCLRRRHGSRTAGLPPVTGRRHVGTALNKPGSFSQVIRAFRLSEPFWPKNQINASGDTRQIPGDSHYNQKFPIYSGAFFVIGGSKGTGDYVSLTVWNGYFL